MGLIEEIKIQIMYNVEQAVNNAISNSILSKPIKVNAEAKVKK